MQTERGAALGELSSLLGDGLLTARGRLEEFSTGEAYDGRAMPDAVAEITQQDQVPAVLAICQRHRMPVVARGAGSSLEGHVVPTRGGVVLDLRRLDRIVAVREADLDCTVEAGVTREQLNAHLRDRGLFFPIDPGADASLGGMASTRASGTNAVRYGTMLHNVLGVRAALIDGTVLETGTRARKSSAGYDLTRLFVGSVGTLGVITQLTLRLYGIPETIAAATCPFADFEGATATVLALLQLGVPVARVEFLDEVQVRACNLYSGLTLDEVPTLFFEFHGTPTSVAEQLRITADLAADNGGGAFQQATSTEDRARLWKARHQAYFAARALRPGTQGLSTDICVPISALPEAIASAKRDIAAAGLVAPIVGHVGDGNFHVIFLYADKDELARAEAIYDRMIEHALSVGGTCTGEHGIGLTKRKKLIAEAGLEGVAAMRAIKRSFDPLNLLNPDKIFLD
jgi:D-lactate dehydrogenase (cytochrome)